jgi:predicted transcriptional regulator
MKKSAAEDQILRTSKEIVVKFIEIGRISPASFPETFKSIYTTVKEIVDSTKSPSDSDS